MSHFPRGDMSAADISRLLADRIESLVTDLLPNGHREGHEWRIGNLQGDPGASLAVHLSGTKAGIWRDFGDAREGGDALGLVAAVLDLTTTAAMDWACRWLGLAAGDVELPRRPTPAPKLVGRKLDDPGRWRYPWGAAPPIHGTLGEHYLQARGLSFDDPEGRVLRLSPARGRQSPAGEIERHPALLCALCDVRTGEQCGIINIFLRPDGSDRIRDKRGKTVTGRAKDAVVLLSPFGAPALGLTICEGVETGIRLLMAGLAPVWACGGMLGGFPVLGGIEALTVAADADEPGEHKAVAVAERWRAAGREVVIVAPPAGDWADPGHVA